MAALAEDRFDCGAARILYPPLSGRDRRH